MVTLHVSVWVEISYIGIHAADSSCHAPRERVSWNPEIIGAIIDGFKSRSTWACELKFNGEDGHVAIATSRSTWACELKWPAIYWCTVTITSRSTWACELKLFVISPEPLTLSSRSTWACELKWNYLQFLHRLKWSRSTWACELKFKDGFADVTATCHAPRERVSWN